MRTPEQRKGDRVERLVADRLAAADWLILGRNVRVGRGELDIVAVDPGPPMATLVFVEVRWRGRRDFGLPEETFDHRKRSRLIAAVARLLDVGHLPSGAQLPRLPIRLDLVVVEPTPRGEPERIRHHRAV